MDVNLAKEQENQLEKIRLLNEQLSQLETDYWYQFSNMGEIKFWVVLLLFVAPLIALLLFIDRRRVFLLCFYGFNIHVWFGYLDTWGVKQGIWEYPYQLLPFLPGNVTLEASLMPVAFIFVYQLTIASFKKYLISTLALSAFWCFILKPIFVMHDLFRLYKGVNFFHLFITLIGVFLFSKLLTYIFLKLSEQSGTFISD